jgi:hypothetical protein
VLIYDMECEISFGRAIEEAQRQAFNEAAGAHRPGWHGPLPVVSWKGVESAVLFLVLKGAGLEDPGAAEAVCAQAEERIREWAGQAGIAASSADAAIVTCQAVPRA